MWQVSSGLKEDLICSQPPPPKSEAGAENSVFDTSRSTASKLALVSDSPLYYDKDVCYTNVCSSSKSHED